MTRSRSLPWAVSMIIMSKVSLEVTVCIIASISRMLLTSLMLHLTSRGSDKSLARLTETTFGSDIGFSFTAFVGADHFDEVLLCQWSTNN